MLRYILRRMLYSIFIILGVLLLTFLLFNAASGDPAAALLGKNPSPREVEDLRSELGCDKPLFFGYYRRTETFRSVDFSEQRLPRGVSVKGKSSFGPQILILNRGRLLFKRNFALKEILQCRVTFSGAFKYQGRVYFSSDNAYSTKAFDVPPDVEILYFKAHQGNTFFKRVEFFREQNSLFDSQFAGAVNELVCLKDEFPYVSFLNFGQTLLTREPVNQILWRGLWPSLSLMVPIFFGELILGIILALLASAFKDTLFDRGIVLAAVIGMSVSYLVFIIAGQWFLGYYWNIFPVWGWGSIKFLLLPICIGIVSSVGANVRFYRTVFVNELRSEYLRTAVAKGCSPLAIYGKHLLRNAGVAVLTRAGASLPFLFTGSLLLETFFGIPGLGYTGVDALNNSDLQLLKALVIVSALLFVGVNLLVDIAYVWADPRIRLDKRT
jgi:peptide/nickel transport system permease protein